MKANYISVEWKRNIRRIPDRVYRKIERIQGDIVVAVVKKVPKQHIEAGLYHHLGLRMEGDLPVVGEPVLPRASQGRYSGWNKYGYIFVHKNRPMVSRTYSIDVPNWGDWSNGSHTVDWSRDVYQRDFISPKLLRIHVEILGQDIKATDSRWIIRFALDEVLSPGIPSFQETLFFNLNLLQENVGACDVFAANATRADYLKTMFVSWEILPPGERNVRIERILGTNSNIPQREKTAFEERYDFLMAYKPAEIVVGTSGFVRYFGAKFADSLVVFENVKYGNAIYVMFEDWEIISQRSRIDLLSQPSDKFLRVIHRPGWKAELRSVLEKHINQQQTFSTN